MLSLCCCIQAILWCMGFSLPWLFLLWSTNLGYMGFSSCGTRALLKTRDRTHDHCIGRRILNHQGSPLKFFFLLVALCSFWEISPFMLQEGGSCLTLRSELSRRHMCWKSERLYWEESPGQRAGGWGNPGGLLCHMARSLRLYSGGNSFQVVSGQSFWLMVLPGGACIAQSRGMPARRILGGGRTRSVSFWPFPNSCGWWWLFSYVFLTRTSCCKITHANCYYGAWPVWAVLSSCFP